jgi:hypothetical protein
MMKIRRCILFLFLFCALTTCALAQRTKAPAAKDYFPLRVGDSWKYHMIDEDGEYTVKVLSAEKQADGTMLYLLEKLVGMEIHDWYSKQDGWVLLHREAYPQQDGVEVKYETPRQFLKNPLVAGATWRWQGKSVAQTNIRESNQVVGPETVKVPAGTFRAMKVISHGSDGEAVVTKTYWYAEGVGLIKWMTEGGQVKYGWELVDYSFKKPQMKK